MVAKWWFLLAGRNSSFKKENAWMQEAAATAILQLGSMGGIEKALMKKLSAGFGILTEKWLPLSELRHIHFEVTTLHPHTHTTHALIDTQKQNISQQLSQYFDDIIFFILKQHAFSHIGMSDV